MHVALIGQNTHWVQGQTKANFGPSVQVGSGIAGTFGPVTVTSPTTAVAQVSIVPNAMPNSINTVTVQTGSETVSQSNAFTVLGIPALTAFSPVSVQPGQSVTVTIGGSFTNFLQGVTLVSFGSGIAVGGGPSGGFGPVTMTSATAATAQVVVDANATLGPRNPLAQTGAELGASTAPFSVLGAVTTTPPTVSITTPAESMQITGPVPVAGTISSANLASWALEYKLADDAKWTQFGAGTTANVNATFDPTMMLNGTVQIRLSALDTTGQAGSALVNAIVTGNQKVGLFTLSYTDVSVPVAGIPIQVTRTYDSRNKNVGDFGYGWTLGLKASRVTVNGAIGDGGSVAPSHARAQSCGGTRVESYSPWRSAAKTHACPCRFFRVIPSTWPLRIICAASIPCITAHAVAFVRGPCMARSRRLMARWSDSIRLLQ